MPVEVEPAEHVAERGGAGGGLAEHVEPLGPEEVGDQRVVRRQRARAERGTREVEPHLGRAGVGGDRLVDDGLALERPLAVGVGHLAPVGVERDVPRPPRQRQPTSRAPRRTPRRPSARARRPTGPGRVSMTVVCCCMACPASRRTRCARRVRVPRGCNGLSIACRIATRDEATLSGAGGSGASSDRSIGVDARLVRVRRRRKAPHTTACARARHDASVAPTGRRGRDRSSAPASSRLPRAARCASACGLRRTSRCPRSRPGGRPRRGCSLRSCRSCRSSSRRLAPMIRLG